MKKSKTNSELSERNRGLMAMRKSLERSENTIEHRQIVEDRILSHKDTYLSLVEYANNVWDTEISNINYSDLNQDQKKEYKSFKKRWKSLRDELNWYDREIKMRTNAFLEILGKTLHSRWGKFQLSDNMGFVFGDYYGITEKPYPCRIPTAYQGSFFELVHFFSLFSIKLSEITDLYLETKHYFNLESEATIRLEEYIKKQKRKRNDRENYKPLAQVLCAQFLRDAAKKQAKNRISYMTLSGQKHLIPKNEYLPDIKSFERKIQRWDASFKGKSGNKPPPFYSRYKTSAEFKAWAEVYEQERFNTWRARKDKLRNRCF